MTVASLALVMILTLYPFDFYIPFGASLGSAISGLSWRDAPEGSVFDIVGNIVLFSPLALGVAALLGRVCAPRTAVLLTIAIGIILSICIELLQFYTPNRATSFVDVAMNAVGSGVGALLAGPAVNWAPPPRTDVPGQGRGVAGASLAALYFVLSLWLVIAAADRFRLEGWSPEFPMSIGNESTGDRPWDGEVNAFWLTQGVVAASDFAGRVTADRLPPGTVAWSLSPIAGGAPALEARGAAPGAAVGALPWRTSSAPVSAASAAIERASAFTLFLDLDIPAAPQMGPARILSISQGARDRNLTVAQEGHDLVLRVRTRASGPNGDRPELIFPGRLVKPGPMVLAISYDGRSLSLTQLDAANRPALSMSLDLEIAFLFSYVPGGVERFQVTQVGLFLLAALFQAIVFFPLGVLLYHSGGTLSGAVFGPVLAVAIVLGWEAVLAIARAAPNGELLRFCLGVVFFLLGRWFSRMLQTPSPGGM